VVRATDRLRAQPFPQCVSTTRTMPGKENYGPWRRSKVPSEPDHGRRRRPRLPTELFAAAAEAVPAADRRISEHEKRKAPKSSAQRNPVGKGGGPAKAVYFPLFRLTTLRKIRWRVRRRRRRRRRRIRPNLRNRTKAGGGGGRTKATGRRCCGGRRRPMMMLRRVLIAQYSKVGAPCMLSQRCSLRNR
jgi:hypothetical protein